MTILLSIASAMKAALNTGRPAGVPEAKYWSGIALEPDDLPARTLAWTSEVAERAGSPTSPLTRRSVRFSVQDLVAGTGAGGQTAQEFGEVLRAWTVSALAGNRYADGSGGFWALDTVEVETAWEFEQGEIPFCRSTHVFEVTFTTRGNNAELRA